jgi:hypothetical protein
MKTDKKGTCVYEKDIHVSHKGQSAATNREKGQGVTRTRAGVNCYLMLMGCLIYFEDFFVEILMFMIFSSIYILGLF